MEGDAWDMVPSYIKDLVRRLLVQDPVDRMTADQVLSNEWMVGTNVGGANRDLAEASELSIAHRRASTTMDRVSRMSIQCTLKKRLLQRTRLLNQFQNVVEMAQQKEARAMEVRPTLHDLSLV